MYFSVCVCIHKDMLTCGCGHACICVCVDHPWLCQLLHLSSISCCFGPNPSCWPASPQRRSNTVFPLNQMKKVKRRTWLPEPEGSARTPRTSRFFPVIQHNKGATSAQEIITTSTLDDYFLTKTQRVQRVQNNKDAFVVQSSLRCFKYLLLHHTCLRGSLDHSRDCKQYLNNNVLNNLNGN